MMWKIVCTVVQWVNTVQLTELMLNIDGNQLKTGFLLGCQNSLIAYAIVYVHLNENKIILIGLVFFPRVDQQYKINYSSNECLEI